MPLGRARLDKVVESYFMIGGYEVQSGSLEMQVPAMRNPGLRENVVRLYEHGKDSLAEALGAKEHPEHREFLRLAGEMVLSFTDGLNLQVLMNPDADYDPVISLFQDTLYRTVAPVLGLDDSAETQPHLRALVLAYVTLLCVAISLGRPREYADSGTSDPPC